jgi:hypothetical protein
MNERRNLRIKLGLIGTGAVLVSVFGGATIIHLLSEANNLLTQIPTSTHEPQPITAPNPNHEPVANILIAENISNVSPVNSNAAVNNTIENTNTIYESVSSGNPNVQCVKLGSWTADHHQTVFGAFKSLGNPNDFNDVKRGGVYINGKYVAFITPDLLSGSHALDNVPEGTVICGELTIPPVQGS